MALLTDGTLSTIDDLTGLDTGVLEVARTEEIDLRQKLGLARQEIAYRLGENLREAWNAPTALTFAGTLTASNVVADERLLRWHALESLAQVYRDLYHSQLNDRYEKRWEHYQKLSESAYRDYIRGGIPVVTKPIPRPAPPTTTVLAGTLDASTYFLAVSLVRNGEEGEISEATAVTAPDSHVLEVEPPSLPEGTDAWNLYAGFAQDSLVLQNSTPQAFTATFALEAVVTDSQKPSSGQAPELIIRPRQRLRRG